MKKTYTLKKKHCIEFEDFAFDLGISAKHSDYSIEEYEYDLLNNIDIGEEEYGCTMEDFSLGTFKDGNWELLDEKYNLILNK